MAENTPKSAFIVKIAGEKKLQDIFFDGWQLYDEIETTLLLPNSSEFQKKVKTAIELFENATRIINHIGMFSSNELIDEVSTDSLKYMLLPYFLGKLTTKINEPNNIELMIASEVYFMNYLQRCQDYELCNWPKNDENATSKEQNGKSEMQKFMQAAFNRNEKIAQYRKMKELNEYINKTKAAIKSHGIDDEVKREFYMKMLDKSIIDAKQELQMLHDLKEMAKLRNLRLSGGESAPDVSSSSSYSRLADNYQRHEHAHAHGHQQTSKPKPLEPFVITRDAAQKAVFGMGYPSLPIMTVNEFYEQRVREGIFPSAEKVVQMNEAQAIAATQDPNEKEDAEKAALEEQIENDDPENLARMRRMDEYKDVVRRGDGNRYNRS